MALWGYNIWVAQLKYKENPVTEQTLSSSGVANFLWRPGRTNHNARPKEKSLT